MWEGAIAKMTVCMKFRVTPSNMGWGEGWGGDVEAERASSGTRSEKQIERKILHVYMDLFFSSRLLLRLKALLNRKFLIS